MTYAELANRLKKHGFKDETEASITMRLKRGTFSATFFLGMPCGHGTGRRSVGGDLVRAWGLALRRFRIPEIVLGMLLTIAAVAIYSVLIIYPKDNAAKSKPTNNPPQVALETAINQRIADYNEALDWLTGFLVAANIALWLATWRSGVRQSHDTAAFIGETRRLGEAQVRAYVDIRAATVVFLQMTEGAVPLADVQPLVRITAKNTGQSPARNFVWHPTVHYCSFSTPIRNLYRRLGGNWREIAGIGIPVGEEHSGGAMVTNFMGHLCHCRVANRWADQCDAIGIAIV